MSASREGKHNGQPPPFARPARNPAAKIGGVELLIETAHRYFDAPHAVLQGTVEHDLPEVEEAIHRLDARLTNADTDPG